MLLNKLIKLCVVGTVFLPALVLAGNQTGSSTQQNIGSDSQTNIRSNQSLDSELRRESESDAKLRGQQDADDRFELETKTRTDGDDFVKQRSNSSFDTDTNETNSMPDSVPSEGSTMEQDAGQNNDINN